MLVERILRNLVSNAVRHTRKRPRAGRLPAARRAALASGLGTGPGIPADQQELVFQEYYQLGNPERDRGPRSRPRPRNRAPADGADRRLAGAALRARPRLLLRDRLPLAHSRGSARRGACQAPSLGALATGLVVVIDDELAIREAMTTLLETLGPSGGRRQQRRRGGRAAGDLSRTSPDLIISDFRLRDGENGIAAIEGLRSEYNEAIPAMLITGDTAPDRLGEAQASGLLLLHKPVPNSRLRAAIVNLIGR